MKSSWEELNSTSLKVIGHIHLRSNSLGILWQPMTSIVVYYERKVRYGASLAAVILDQSLSKFIVDWGPAEVLVSKAVHW